MYSIWEQNTIVTIITYLSQLFIATQHHQYKSIKFMSIQYNKYYTNV